MRARRRLSERTRRRREVTSAREVKEKIGRVGGATRGHRGDEAPPSRFGRGHVSAAQVTWDWEHDDSVHGGQRGAITGGIIWAVSFVKCLSCFFQGLSRFFPVSYSVVF